MVNMCSYHTPPLRATSEGPIGLFVKENYAMDSGWNRIFGDLETFLNIFFIFWPEKIPGHAKIARNITP